MPGHPARPPRTRDRGARLPLAALALAAAVLGAPRAATAQEWAVLAQPTTQDLRKLSFTDRYHGWAAGDSGTILVTTDGGGTWAAQASPVGYDVVDIQMLGTGRGWALAQQRPAPPDWEYGTTLLRTVNGGASWLVQSTFDGLFVHALAFTDAQWGCLGGEQGNLWWTSDGGATWTPSVVDSAQFARWPVHDVTFRTPTYGMATGGLYDVTGLVWRTTDRGQSWTHQRVAGEPIFGTHFFDSLNVVCVGGDLDYGSGMVRTSNGGANWQYTNLGIWGRASAIAFRTPTEGWSPLGFAGTYMKTRDGGNRWDVAPTPGGVAMHDVVFPDGATGFMAGDAGTILEYVGDTSSIEIPGNAPGDRAPWLQVSPNPFAPEARVDFQVPGSAFVSLRIYDVRGREVARLVDGRLPGGLHSRVFRGDGLPNGVYFGRLVVDGETGTTKMLLVR